MPSPKALNSRDLDSNIGETDKHINSIAPHIAVVILILLLNKFEFWQKAKQVSMHIFERKY